MRSVMAFTVTAAVLTSLAGPVVAQQAPADSPAACAQMLQGMSEEGRRAMQELMASGRAAGLMDGMMQMAGRMGNGDAMAGMARMMEMMGRMGGMMGPGGTMGSQGGPTPTQPKP